MLGELFGQHGVGENTRFQTRMNRTAVAKRSKRTTKSKDDKNGKPSDLDSVLESVRALWEITDKTDADIRDDLRKRITDELGRLEKKVRTKLNVAEIVRSRQKADSAQIKLFPEEPSSPPPSRFEETEVKVFVTDLAEQALKLLPEAARFSSAEDFRKVLIDKLPYNSISTRKRYADYFVNRFFTGNYLHPDLTAFAAAARDSSLGNVLFYLTARSERILQLIAEQVVWPALPVGSIARSKIRDFARAQLKGEAATKKTATAVVNCYDKFGIADVTKTKVGVKVRSGGLIPTGDLASFAYVLHLEFPEPGMQPFEKVLDGPMHKWLLWDRQWMIQHLYRLREEGLLSKISEIDSMRQFTMKYSLAEATPHIVKLIGKEDA